MARDGSGNHSLPEAAFVSGTTIDSAKVNSNFSDISSALSGSLAKDGQTVPTANLPMGGFKHTNVAVATSRTDYARASQIADNSMGYALSSGTDTITATPAPGISAYAIGQRFTLKKDANANTGAVTLNVNAIGAGNVTWPDGTALAAGDLPANCMFEVVVQATTPVFHLQTTPSPNAAITPSSRTIYAGMTPQGRLTLSTGVPVPTSNVTAATAIYYAPYNGNLVPIYDGTGFKWTVFTELTNTTTDNTKNPAAVTTNSNYDLFVWNDSGTIRLGRGPAWTSNTARGTGAGTTELERVGGLLLNKVAITNGPAANRGTYVGTVRSDGSSQINMTFGGAAAGGTAAILGVWNMYNRVDVSGQIGDTTNSWTYSTATWRSADNSTAMRCSLVSGSQEDTASFFATAAVSTAVSGAVGVGIGYNSTSAPSGTTPPVQLSGTNIAAPVARYSVRPLGFNYVQQLEFGTAAGTTTWYGDNGSSEAWTAMIYEWRC